MTKEMTQEERGLVREAYGRLSRWRDGCREMHERAREARKILLLQDPRQDAGNARRDKPTMQLQTLKSTFNNCVADQMDNLPEAVMLPERRELEGVAEDLTDLVRFVMNRNDREALHRRRVEDCFCTGTAVTQVAWDPDMDGGRGNVAVIRWPIEAFLWDPAAERLEDARAVFKVSWHPKSWFEEHYPDRAREIGGDFGEYAGLGVSDAQEETHPADEDRAMLVEYWYRKYDAKKRSYTINVAYLAGGVLLNHIENVYSHGQYPFILDVYTPIEGTPVGDGLVQEMAPMMRYVNRYFSYIDTNLRMASKGRLLVDRSAGIDKDALLDWESDVIEGDRIDASALKWMQSAPLTSLATAQLSQLEADIKQDSGQNQFSRGETVGGVTAATAINALQEAGGKITRLRTASLNQGYRRIVEQVMWLISQFYDEGRVMFITGRDVDVSPSRLFEARTPPPYIVEVQVQRRNPLRQQAQNELFMQAYQMASQAGQTFPLSVLFDLLSVDGKERIVPVLREIELLPAMELEQSHSEAGERAGRLLAQGQEMASQLQAMVREREELLNEMAQMQSELTAAREALAAGE